MSHTLTCRSCGCTFVAARRHALTCSNACRTRRHSERRMALIADLTAVAHEAAAIKLAA